MTHHVLTLNTLTVVLGAIAIIAVGYLLFALGKEVGSQKAAVKFLAPRGVDPVFPEFKRIRP